MRQDICRFFIELQMEDHEVPRHREAAVRRAQAAQFIEQYASWLQGQDMNAEVSMAITALGQVQVTCVPDIIERLHAHETYPHIAAIRRSAPLSDSIQRIGGR
jgi:hypothetical protein